MFGDYTHLSCGVVGVHPTVDVDSLAVAENRVLAQFIKLQKPQTTSTVQNTTRTPSD